VCIKTGIRYGQDPVWRSAAGEPTRPPRHVAFQIWSAYSPQRAWPSLAEEYEDARSAFEIGLYGPMQGFANESLGLTWETIGAKADEHVLKLRAEPFALGTVPIGALVLTAGVDIQGNRGELGVWGWASGLESWTVDHRIVEGNPLTDEFWEQIELQLRRRFPQAWPGGGSLGLDAISIDANYLTQAVLNFVRLRQASLPVYAARGEGDPKKPIKGPANPQDVTWQGKKYPAGVRLWQVGVKQAKDLVHGQLEVLLDEGEARRRGYVHFSRDLDTEWYEQLTAEQRITVIERGTTVERWMKRRPRNEVLDCRVYATHAAEMLGIPHWSEKRWAEVEARVQPAQIVVPPGSTQAPDKPRAQLVDTGIKPVITGLSTMARFQRGGR
jgi:terminase, large subunit